MLSEFSKGPLRETFYSAHDFSNLNVADPFMGGGTPIVEANRIGCNVVGFDINPMSYWIVKQELEYLDLVEYAEAADSLRSKLEKSIGGFYRTRCGFCRSADAHVKYFIWVKKQVCDHCGKEIDLFPGYLLSADSRHTANVIVCGKCGELNEVEDRDPPGRCGFCSGTLTIKGPAKRSRCQCRECGRDNRFPKLDGSPPDHRLFAIEYHCPKCKPSHRGRFFKKPDSIDLDKFEEARQRWIKTRPEYVPGDEIPSGDETNRLHRWGYKKYKDMFNDRQLLALELSARIVSETGNERIRNALATNFSDLFRYQNMLCRYDKRALKSLDIFSVHGFPVGLIQCESNFLGIMDPKRDACIGSGGWANIVEKFKKAKSYCDRPFEFKHQGRKKTIVYIDGEWIGDSFEGIDPKSERSVDISCRNAGAAELREGFLDAVFTDPPYYGNVQYAELMDFCYVWLRKLAGSQMQAFAAESTRSPTN